MLRQKTLFRNCAYNNIQNHESQVNHDSKTQPESQEKSTCDVAGQAVYVYVEEQVRVAGAHVEEQVEERREHGDTEVDDGEERHHLEGAP